MPKDDITNLPNPASGKSGPNPWLPVLTLIVLLPALSYAMVEYVFIPRLKEAMQSGPAVTTSGEQTGGVVQSVEFKNIVANLSGSLRSRYLKVSFTVQGSFPEFPTLIEDNRVKLTDAAIGVLSALSVQDLEEPGVKNLVRTHLLEAFETALGSPLVEELYFSEFVIQ